MIDIKRFREYLVELMVYTNDESSADVQIEGVAIGVHQGHMIKKLKDKSGIWLCANYPDAVMSGTDDQHSDRNKVVLFLMEKVSSGQHTDDEELDHYAKMQHLFLILRKYLLNNSASCGQFVTGEALEQEWEYDIFGGWNGLSVMFNLNDYD